MLLPGDSDPGDLHIIGYSGAYCHLQRLDPGVRILLARAIGMLHQLMWSPPNSKHGFGVGIHHYDFCRLCTAVDTKKGAAGGHTLEVAG
jgi:hypothetical protein